MIIGKLNEAETSYSTAIDLCKENLDNVADKFGVRKCDDLYVLYLNRGSLRLNNNMKKVCVPISHATCHDSIKF